MSLLAFDTSTSTMSIAIKHQDGRVWQHEALGATQSSTQLIPTIERLMALAQLRFHQLRAIVFGQGPGSFTGLRTACSVAQGLSFASQVPVLPVQTLLAVAEEARFTYVPHLCQWRVLALLDARMDEMYAGHYQYQDGQWRSDGPIHLLRPEDLRPNAACAWAGNVFATYGTRMPRSTHPALVRWHAQPSALALLRLAPQLLSAGGAQAAEQALPLYIRDKVAQTTLERAAKKGLA